MELLSTHFLFQVGLVDVAVFMVYLYSQNIEESIEK